MAQTMEKQKIGFFALFDTETPDSHVGALLITDEHGIPLEFKCTHAVKPTAIQKTLYGEKLRPYIANALCGAPLLSSAGNKPSVIFVNAHYALGLRQETQIPTLLVKSAGEAINLVKGDSDDSARSRLENSTGTYQPVVIQPHPSFKDDLKELNEQVQTLFNQFDLNEPFERMQKSIGILGRNDSKFK